MKTKSLFASKSALLGVVTALLGCVSSFVPSVGAWAGEHMSTILGVIGVLGILLRLITSGRVELFPEDNK